MDDLVSRQAVRHILNHEVKMPIEVWKKLFELVDRLPPVTPQQSDYENMNILFLMHKELDIPISECQKAYDIAIDYLRRQASIKG